MSLQPFTEAQMIDIKALIERAEKAWDGWDHTPDSWLAAVRIVPELVEALKESQERLQEWTTQYVRWIHDNNRLFPEAQVLRAERDQLAEKLKEAEANTVCALDWAKACDERDALRADLEIADAQARYWEGSYSDERKEVDALRAENELMRHALHTYAQYAMNGETAFVSGYLAKEAMKSLPPRDVKEKTK
jgi:hypothetical protein